MALGKPKLSKMQIKATRFINKNGDEMYHIDSIEGVAFRSELPDEYLRGECVYYETFPGGREGIALQPRGKSIVVGSNMTRAEFETSYMYATQCGSRLMEINDRIDEKRKKWNGQAVYEV